MDAIVESLDLTKVGYLRSFLASDLVYNLRNINLNPEELNSSKAPYNLDTVEKGKYPYELFRSVTQTFHCYMLAIDQMYFCGQL